MTNKNPNFNVIPGNKTRGPKAKRPVNPQMTIQVTNPKVEKLIDEWKANQSPATLAPVLNALRGARVLVPALMKEVNGKTMPIPATLVDKDDQKFLWAFTSRAKLPADKKEQGYMNMAFLDLVKLSLLQQVDLTGIAVNPVTGGITIRKPALEALEKGELQFPDPAASQAAIQLNNGEAEKMMAEFKEGPGLEKQVEIINALWESRVLVPVELHEKDGKQLPLPMVQKDKEEKKRIPIYTSAANIPEQERKANVTVMNLPFRDVLTTAVNLAEKDENFTGLVFNPTVHGLIFNNQIVRLIADRMKDTEKPQKLEVSDFQTAQPQTRTIQLSEAQYLAFEHIQFETSFFPKKFMNGGQAFVEELCDRRESYMDELFEESYQQKRLYPYLEEEFSVMALGLSEDMDVIRVDFPQRDQTLGCCPRAYLTWDKKAQQGRYFAIITQKNKSLSIIEVDGQGMGTDCGPCPAEGNELNRIMELVKE